MTEAVSHTKQLKQKLVVWCYECEEFVYFKDLEESKWHKLMHFSCPKCKTNLDWQGTVLLEKDVLPLAEKLNKTEARLDRVKQLLENRPKLQKGKTGKYFFCSKEEMEKLFVALERAVHE